MDRSKSKRWRSIDTPDYEGDGWESSSEHEEANDDLFKNQFHGHHDSFGDVDKTEQLENRPPQSITAHEVERGSENNATDFATSQSLRSPNANDTTLSVEDIGRMQMLRTNSENRDAVNFEGMANVGGKHLILTCNSSGDEVIDLQAVNAVEHASAPYNDHTENKKPNGFEHSIQDASGREQPAYQFNVVHEVPVDNLNLLTPFAANTPLAHPAILAAVHYDDFNRTHGDHGEVLPPSRPTYLDLPAKEPAHALSGNQTEGQKNCNSPEEGKRSKELSALDSVHSSSNLKTLPDNRIPQTTWDGNDLRDSENGLLTLGIVHSSLDRSVNSNSVANTANDSPAIDSPAPLDPGAVSRFQEVLSPSNSIAPSSIHFASSGQCVMDRSRILSLPDSSKRIRAFEELRLELAQIDLGLREWAQSLTNSRDGLGRSGNETSNASPLTISFTSSGSNLNQRSVSGAGSKTAAVSVSAAKGVWAGMKKGGKAISHAGQHVSRKKEFPSHRYSFKDVNSETKRRQGGVWTMPAGNDETDLNQASSSKHNQ